MLLGLGIPLTKLEAGAGWDGYRASDGKYHAPAPKKFDDPWWIPIFASQVDSTYVISTLPVEGYSVMAVRPYLLWLQTRQASLYLYLSKRVEPEEGVGTSTPAPESESESERSRAKVQAQ